MYHSCLLSFYFFVMSVCFLIFNFFSLKTAGDEPSPDMIKNQAMRSAGSSAIEPYQNPLQKQQSEEQKKQEYMTAAKAAERKEAIKMWRSTPANPDYSYGRRKLKQEETQQIKEVEALAKKEYEEIYGEEVRSQNI